MGAVPESQVRQFVDQLAAAADKAAGHPIDEALEQVKRSPLNRETHRRRVPFTASSPARPSQCESYGRHGPMLPRNRTSRGGSRNLDSIPEDQNNDPDVTAFRMHELAAQVNTSSGLKQRRSKKRSRQTQKTIKFASTLPLPITVTAQTSKRSMPCLIFYAQTLVGMREPPASNWSRYLRHWVTLIRTQWKVGRRWRPFSLPSVSRYGRDRPTGLNPCLPPYPECFCSREVEYH